MLDHRITKYDPALRDPHGAYTRDEWTAFSDIGRAFGGVVLTPDAYRRVEDAYVTVALAFLREAGVASLAVAGIEDRGAGPLPFGEGSVLGLEALDDAIRRVLREEVWCQFEGADAFVHLGYDYYMYVGVPGPCPASRALAGRLGLFVEELPLALPGRSMGGERTVLVHGNSTATVRERCTKRERRYRFRTRGRCQRNCIQQRAWLPVLRTPLPDGRGAGRLASSPGHLPLNALTGKERAAVERPRRVLALAAGAVRPATRHHVAAMPWASNIPSKSAVVR